MGGLGLFLAFPLLPFVVPDRLPLAWRTIEGAALVVVAAATYQLIERRLPRVPVPGGTAEPELPRTWALTGSIASLVLATIMIRGGESLFWAVGPAVMVAMLSAYLDVPARAWLIGSATLATAGTSALLGLGTEDEPAWFAPVWAGGVVAFAAFVSLAQLWTWNVAARLDDARQVAGRLAVADERLRFAADLHDIQGHHLQVIALKSELAARLAAADTDAAAEQMREVQQLAAEALRDTREVVYGLRRTSLDAEIANATGVLAAADIDGRMRIDPALDPSQPSETCRHLLGLLVREAVTNILRHSDAARADLDLHLDDGAVRLEVRNDGLHHGGLHHGGEDDGEAADPSARRPGGLAALAERLASADGELTWERDGGWFVLRATLPVYAEQRLRA